MRAVGYRTFMHDFFAGMFFEGSDPALQEHIVTRALALPEAVGATLFPRIAAWDARSVEAALAQVAVPLLVIQSTSVNRERVRVSLEPGAGSPWVELVRHLVPEAQVETVSGAGHFVMMERPLAVNRCIEAFIVRLSQSG